MRIHHWVGLAILSAVIIASHVLAGQQGGRNLAFSLLVGLALGVTLQRSRFCFLCHSRDWFESRDPRGLLSILAALAVGSVGYTIILGGWLAVPEAGRLPPDAHIGPVSWVLVLAGLAFGFGMVISGSCISAHWYRLGEGSPVAPFALMGTAGGFLLGFNTWNTLYTAAIATAPKVWLPHWLGYGGALLLQLAVLAVLAGLLWRNFPVPARADQAPQKNWREPLAALVRGRWPYWSGGVIVGMMSVFTIIRLKPLGVTAFIGSTVRHFFEGSSWVPERLEGLDGFAGCATLPQAQWLTPNALLIGGLVAGSLAAAMASRQFEPRLPTLKDASRGLAGGVLLGWGAMTGLGCTIGTLLSGIQAGAISGWIFAAAVFAALWAGFNLQRIISRLG